MVLFYIPLLIFSSDTNTGEQKQYPFLWPLTITVVVVAFTGIIIRDIWRMRQRKRAKAKLEEKDVSHLNSRDLGDLDVDEVKVCWNYLIDDCGLAQIVHVLLRCMYSSIAPLLFLQKEWISHSGASPCARSACRPT